MLTLATCVGCMGGLASATTPRQHAYLSQRTPANPHPPCTFHRTAAAAMPVAGNPQQCQTVPLPRPTRTRPIIPVARMAVAYCLLPPPLQSEVMDRTTRNDQADPIARGLDLAVRVIEAARGLARASVRSLRPPNA